MRKSLLVFFLSCCSFIWSQSTHSYSVNPGFCRLYIHNETADGYGVIDQNGQWLMKPEFEYIWINENRIAARKNWKWALFDIKGKQLTDFSFGDIEMEDYGWGYNYMETMVDSWKYYGLIDTNGKEILPPIYSYINASHCYDHHKCISYCLGEDSCGVLDSNLRPIIDPLYSGSICIYPQYQRIFKNGKTGIFDYSGNQIGNDWYGTEIESIGFLMYGKFLPVERNGKFGILNIQTGRYLVEPSYEKLTANFVTPDAGFFYWENGHLGLMDTLGKHITPAIYQTELVDYDSRTIALMKDSLWGLVDLSGKTIIPFEYEYYMDFETVECDSTTVHIVEVQKNGRYGYFTDQGTMISAPQYEDRRGFTDQFARVSKDKLWGLMNVKGEVIIPMIYEEIGGTYPGGMVVKQNGKYGMINLSNQIIIPIIYDDIEFYPSESLIMVNSNYKWGMLDMNGKIILPVEYGYLSIAGYNRVILYNYFPMQGVWYSNPTYEGLADYKGRIIVPLEYNYVFHVFPNGAAIFDSKDGYVYITSKGKEVKIK